MRFHEKTSRFIVLGMMLTVGFGCKFFQLKEYVEHVEEPKKTVMTKEVLSERLAALFTKMAAEAPSEKLNSPIPPSDPRKIETHENEAPSGKPNPLILQLKFSTGNNNFLLNNEPRKSFGELANQLRDTFRMREENGIFIEGTNEIYKKITLPAYQKLIDEYNSKNIFVEDFEKLVDDLRNEGFDQIELDVNEENYPLIPNAAKNRVLEARRKSSVDSETEPKKSVDIKAISGGVLNGKAVDLPKPVYPAAAQAVRAGGAVNVQVTVDEKGDVIEAAAVSGHPLLRTAALASARNAKFNPTLLSGKAVKVRGIIVYNFVP